MVGMATIMLKMNQRNKTFLAQLYPFEIFMISQRDRENTNKLMKKRNKSLLQFLFTGKRPTSGLQFTAVLAIPNMNVTHKSCKPKETLKGLLKFD